MRARSLIAGLVLLVSCDGHTASAAELTAQEIESIVAQSAAKYTAAFEERDAAAIAELFTSEAEYVDAGGTVFHGRAAIQNELTASFEAGTPGKLSIEVVSIRPIADGLIVEEGGSTFRPEGDGPVSQTRYIALHMRQTDGSWLMAAVRELAPAELSPHERLKALEWLLGEWREETPGGVTQTKWQWSADGVALEARFTIRDAAGDIRTGLHRVGWDAERKQFRSWIFDSTGGFADGWWSPGADGTWSVRLAGFDAEGVRLAATLTYASDGPENLTIAQRDRSLGGAALPELVTRVVRRPPTPGESSGQ